MRSSLEKQRKLEQKKWETAASNNFDFKHIEIRAINVDTFQNSRFWWVLNVYTMCVYGI